MKPAFLMVVAAVTLSLLESGSAHADVRCKMGMHNTCLPIGVDAETCFATWQILSCDGAPGVSGWTDSSPGSVDANGYSTFSGSSIHVYSSGSATKTSPFQTIQGSVSAAAPAAPGACTEASGGMRKMGVLTPTSCPSAPLLLCVSPQSCGTGKIDFISCHPNSDGSCPAFADCKAHPDPTASVEMKPGVPPPYPVGAASSYSDHINEMKPNIALVVKCQPGQATCTASQAVDAKIYTYGPGPQAVVHLKPNQPFCGKAAVDICVSTTQVYDAKETILGRLPMIGDDHSSTTACNVVNGSCPVYNTCDGDQSIAWAPPPPPTAGAANPATPGSVTAPALPK